MLIQKFTRNVHQKILKSPYPETKVKINKYKV